MTLHVVQLIWPDKCDAHPTALINCILFRAGLGQGSSRYPFACLRSGACRGITPDRFADKARA